MVEFTNIKISKDFIYADAYDRSCNATASIKLSKHKDKLDLYNETDPDSFIAEACWKLQYLYESHNNSLPDVNKLII